MALKLDLLTVFFALGTPVSDPANVREACRQALGGAYLKVYDEKTKADDYAEMLKESLDKLRTAVEAAAKDAKSKRIIAERSGYDLDKAVRRDQAQAKLDVLTSQLAESQHLLATATAARETHAKEERRLRQDLSSVFVFDRHNDQRDGGYPLRIEYKAACPKYRYLCTLPDADVEQLLRIRIDGVLPEPCERYAGLSKLRK